MAVPAAAPRGLAPGQAASFINIDWADRTSVGNTAQYRWPTTPRRDIGRRGGAAHTGDAAWQSGVIPDRVGELSPECTYQQVIPMVVPEGDTWSCPRTIPARV